MMTERLFRMLHWNEILEADRQKPGMPLFISDYNGGHPLVEGVAELGRSEQVVRQ